MKRRMCRAAACVITVIGLSGCGHLGLDGARAWLPGWAGGSDALTAYEFEAPEVIAAIRAAGDATDVPTAFLLATAIQESSLRADARASGSTALGAFQFIESTWLDAIRLFGAEHDLDDVAAAVTTDRRGRPVVADATTRRRILELRLDPYLSALMAAEIAKANADRLGRALGRSAGTTDLYLAHFLGIGGAERFLTAMDTTPDLPGSELFPAAAAVNRAVFYETSAERPRSLKAIYGLFAEKLAVT